MTRRKLSSRGRKWWEIQAVESLYIIFSLFTVGFGLFICWWQTLKSILSQELIIFHVCSLLVTEPNAESLVYENLDFAAVWKDTGTWASWLMSSAGLKVELTVFDEAQYKLLLSCLNSLINHVQSSIFTESKENPDDSETLGWTCLMVTSASDPMQHIHRPFCCSGMTFKHLLLCCSLL